jgi:16S rRNA (adenine1518-N6/adenine1519-N6)-dimethyltransferase
LASRRFLGGEQRLHEVGVTQSIATLLRAHGLHPRKRLGQNFLADPVVLGWIVAAADLAPGDVVVEVGAGTGTLTRLLAEQAGRVVALELDDGLVRILHEELAHLANVEIRQCNVLSFSTAEFPHQGFKVVGNLPYYITSAVLRHFLEKIPRPQLVVATLQREVADRIVARPGQMSLLAVSVQFYGRPRIVARVPAGAFYPAPKVDSAVVRIDVGEGTAALLGKGIDEAGFFRTVRAGFSQKRKTLRNSLSAGLGLSKGSVGALLEEVGLDARRRAETLSLEEWAEVAAAFGGARGHPQ